MAKLLLRNNVWACVDQPSHTLAAGRDGLAAVVHSVCVWQIVDQLFERHFDFSSVPWRVSAVGSREVVELKRINEARLQSAGVGFFQLEVRVEQEGEYDLAVGSVLNVRDLELGGVLTVIDSVVAWRFPEHMTLVIVLLDSFLVDHSESALVI